MLAADPLSPGSCEVSKVSPELHMDQMCSMKWKFVLLIIFVVVWLVLKDFKPGVTIYASVDPIYSTKQTLTPVKGTKHLMVSAYFDHRFNQTTRVISIIERNHLAALYCIVRCLRDNYYITAAEVQMHSDHFGFPFVTTDLLCKAEPTCNATHVTITTSSFVSDIPNKLFLPINNRVKQEGSFPFNFTVCISNLFGDYNNVLQFVQTIEVYKLLGIQKVVIYKTSCGPDLEKVLQHYREEGILEIIPWPINSFLVPSKGWNFAEHKGDIHYWGQLTTLNDCIYRNMYRSKYVLLNDIDEIIMPYKHATLELLLEDLRGQHPNVTVFLIENHIFPKNVFEDSRKFSLPQWKQVPGINVLEHVYREPDRPNVFNPTKIIINPREVEQTSVHSVLKNSGGTFMVPPDVCRIIHVRVHEQADLTKEQLIVDKKLWEYEEILIPNIDHVLKNSGVKKSTVDKGS